MLIQRVPLPASATIVATPGLILLDSQLGRDSAALAIAGVLPTTHPDVVEHWLDQVYDRRRPGLLTRSSAAALLAAVAVLLAPVGAHVTTHHAGRPAPAAHASRRMVV